MKTMGVKILGIPKEESQKSDLEILFESLGKGDKRKIRKANEEALQIYLNRITEKAKTRFQEHDSLISEN